MLMKNVHTFMEDQITRGKFFFTKEHAQEALNLSHNAFHLQIQRLSKKKKVTLVGHGLYSIVPDEYRYDGCLPTHWVIDPYFRHLKEDYYVGLLSAAAFYGATQQQPMVFQVMVNHARRPLTITQHRVVTFHLQQHLDKAHIEERQTPTGCIRLSTRHQTIVDLIRFPKQAGYLNNVALIIKELIEEASLEGFEEILIPCKTAILQRLGYILDKLEAFGFSACVQSVLGKRRVLRSNLRPDVPRQEGAYDVKWKLVVNDPLEIDK